jgi:hypothetical protein
MTDTAKPTPGDWVINRHVVVPEVINANGGQAICLVTGRDWEGNAALIAEAGTVHHETGLTPRQLMEQRDTAYAERNQCVAALARCAGALRYPVSVTKTDIPGWDSVWHNCVYIDLPTGQVSWHFHDDDAELFAGLPATFGSQWDGHDTPEKYRRVNTWQPGDQTRQLLEQRDGLAATVAALLEWVREFQPYAVLSKASLAASWEMDRITERAKAALAKCGKMCSPDSY